LYYRIGNVFIDVAKISQIAVVTEYDPRDNDGYQIVKIYFENEGKTETLSLSESEAKKHPLLAQFLSGQATVRL
jgi:hypothetical protein